MTKNDASKTPILALAESQKQFVPQPASDNQAPPNRVVAVGASAGGLEPLEQFFEKMPTPNGMAFVVIQHLSPDFKSVMDELLLRHTAMPIRQAQQGMRVQADTIYLMPPRKTMTIDDGVLQLQDTPDLGRLMLPIDLFLSSLAEDQRELSVSIILSGTGSDGSIGSKKIEQVGGSVLIQEPDSCKFDGMPRNAMAAVDQMIIATPAEMPEYLLRSAHQSKAIGGETIPVAQETPRSRILNQLRNAFQTDFDHYKTNTIIRRIERRAQLVKSPNLEDYANTVENDPAELDLLFSDLLIGVTAFFRDPEAFRAIEKHVLPDLLEWMSTTRPIRIWVPGCATGEEAYSLAIMLHDHCQRSGQRPNIKIFATDLHQKSLDKASAGRFAPDTVANLPKSFLDRYFDKGDHYYQISSEIRRYVVFSRQNLLEDPPFTRIDMVSCRNVLIYFTEDAQRRILSLFHFALRKDGFTVLGPSESMGSLAEEFENIDNRWRVFRKIRDVRLHDGHVKQQAALQTLSGYQHQSDKGAMSRGVGQRYLIPAYEMLLSRHAPPSLLIDRRGDLAHVFGNAKDYLRVHEGIFTQRLLDHIHPDLKVPLSSIIERAWRQMASVTSRCPMQRSGEDGSKSGARVSIEVTAEPLANSTDRGSFLLITFDAIEKQPLPVPDETSQDCLEVGRSDQFETLQGRVQNLERDLMFTEESLQSVIEELETSNEELQATNEELMASNEELQSTNEELHSVNEELYTVSAEHQQKIDELTQLGADMDNLLRSTDIGTIFVDHRLHIRRYTPAIAQLFNLLDHDIGRPIEHVTFRFEDEHLHRDMRHVLKAVEPVEREVTLGSDQVFFMRILPYMDGTHQCAGVVVTFVDVTPVKRAEASTGELQVQLIEQSKAETERSRDQLFTLLDQAPLMISVHEGESHKIVLTNKLFGESLPTAEPVKGKALKDAFPELCQDGGLERFDHVLNAGEISAIHDIRLPARDSRRQEQHFSQILQPYYGRDGQRIGVISYAFDVTPVSLARREAERLGNALREQRERLELAFSAGRMGYCSLKLDAGTIVLSTNASNILGLGDRGSAMPLGDFAQILEPASARTFTNFLEAARQTSDASDLELELLQADQEATTDAAPRWLRLFGRPSDRDRQDFTAILADVTPIKQAEALLSARAAALEEANTHLEQFVSVASHDLKSPLRGIHHLVEFMRDDLARRDSAQLEGYLDRIADQAIKLSRMLDDLLEYARQADDLSPIELVDTAALIRDAAGIVMPPESFSLELLGQFPKLRTSPGALSLVFRNLIANAVQHGERMDGRLTIAAEELGDGHWQFALEDNGPGLSAERQQELNAYLAGDAEKPASLRLGLGMVFVKRAVDIHGSKLEFATALDGQGCRIVFDWYDNHESEPSQESP